MCQLKVIYLFLHTEGTRQNWLKATKGTSDLRRQFIVALHTDSTVSVKTEHGDEVSGAPDLGAGELKKTMRFVVINKTENNSRNLDRNESSDTSMKITFLVIAFLSLRFIENYTWKATIRPSPAIL